MLFQSVSHSNLVHSVSCCLDVWCHVSACSVFHCDLSRAFFSSVSSFCVHNIHYACLFCTYLWLLNVSSYLNAFPHDHQNTKRLKIQRIVFFIIWISFVVKQKQEHAFYGELAVVIMVVTYVWSMSAESSYIEQWKQHINLHLCSKKQGSI